MALIELRSYALCTKFWHRGGGGGLPAPWTPPPQDGRRKSCDPIELRSGGRRLAGCANARESSLMTGEFAVGQADRLNRASRTGLRPSLMFSVAAALVVLVFVFAVGTAPVARAETGPTVRVRVLANQPEVIISNAKGRSIRVVAGASELVAAGVPRGARYKTPGKGP